MYRLSVVGVLVFALSIASPLGGNRAMSIDLGWIANPSDFYGSVDYLRLRPRQGGLDFAISDSDNDNNIEGPINRLNYDSESAVRARLGLALTSEWDLSFGYTRLRTDASASVDAPAGGQLWITQSNPASFNNSATNASAEIALDYDLYDLQAGYWFRPSKTVFINLFGGPRGAVIHQSSEVAYTGGTVTETRTQTQKTELEGFGVRLGGEVQWQLASMINVFASSSATMIVGNFDIEYVESEPAIATGNVATSSNFYDSVSNFEAAAGISLGTDRISLQAGYELSNWLNIDRRLLFTGSPSISRGQLTSTAEDMLLDGLFLRLALAY